MTDRAYRGGVGRSGGISAVFAPSARMHAAFTAWWGKRAVIQRALNLVDNNGLHHMTNEEEFAKRLGVSVRNLRRLFEEEIGRMPQTNRRCQPPQLRARTDR